MFISFVDRKRFLSTQGKTALHYSVDDPPDKKIVPVSILIKDSKIKRDIVDNKKQTPLEIVNSQQSRFAKDKNPKEFEFYQTVIIEITDRWYMKLLIICV